MPSIKRVQSPTLVIVNTVWKGDVFASVSLDALNIACEHGVIKVKLQKTQPEQYIVKFDNSSTMLIFKSGKFRVMGNGDPAAAIVNTLNVVGQFTAVIPIDFFIMIKKSMVIPLVTMQTMTGVYGYDRNIH